MELSIIIINYNGKKYLKNCLNSIKIQCQEINHEIIIWDNASSDDSVSFLKENYKNEIILIESKHNLGFAGGNNAASKYASGEFLFLLNNDTILLDPIKPAIDLMKTDPSIGILGVKMLNGDKVYLNSCGSLPKPHQFLFFKTFSNLGGSFVNGKFIEPETPINVGWCSGSFIITPKKLWTKIGGLDESYFMYVEDVDYNKAVALLGYKRVFFPSIKYIHFVGFNNTKNALLVKGYRIYIKKHFKGIQKLIATICLTCNAAVKRLKYM